jgi:murein DD-endopeptidase MepM/ murein hydrolase activator NlpD
MSGWSFGVLLAGWLAMAAARGETFILPTPNRAILESGLGEKYLVGTIGRTWESGGFGCVRSEGHKMHEGLDIRCTQRDARNEPIDPVFASADGTVVYASNRPGLSNYGRYIVIRHQIEGLGICTLYGHLSEIAPGIAAGRAVKQGERIATMGRSANTREGISKERAHLHFEIDFTLNEGYAAWHAKFLSGQRNDHGAWNGLNLAALDAGAILLAQQRDGAKFSLVKELRDRTEVCRVFVRDAKFSFLKHYAPLIKRNPLADKEGALGYEISLDFNGAPIELIPRSPAEVDHSQKMKVLSVNERELAKHKCCRLLVQRAGRFELSNSGKQRLELLIYQ